MRSDPPHGLLRFFAQNGILSKQNDPLMFGCRQGKKGEREGGRLLLFTFYRFLRDLKNSHTLSGLEIRSDVERSSSAICQVMKPSMKEIKLLRRKM